MNDQRAVVLWTNPDVVEMVERQGVPQWRNDNGLHVRMVFRVGCFEIQTRPYDVGEWTTSRLISNHEGLAILRDDSRVRIEEAGLAVFPIVDSSRVYVILDVQGCGDGGMKILKTAKAFYWTYDEGLIEARRLLDSEANVARGTAFSATSVQRREGGQ